MARRPRLMFAVIALVGVACSTATEDSGPVDDGITRFAVIGDFGLGTPGAMAVAERIETWDVDFIITLGDNNYPEGSASTIDRNIGSMYSGWIYPYTGEHTPGTAPNRFFPTLGNHDWMTPGVQPYLDYFTLPGNERYYDFEWGNVHLFALDSDSDEPDGITEDSVQGQWFADKVAGSTAPFQVAYFHHPPYSRDRKSTSMRWDWEGAGIDVVLSGHEHWYERFDKNGFPYVINGLGGALWDSIPEPAPEDSVVSFSGALGAMLVEASETEMTLTMITADGEEIDRFTVTP